VQLEQCYKRRNVQKFNNTSNKILHCYVFLSRLCVLSILSALLRLAIIAFARQFRGQGHLMRDVTSTGRLLRLRVVPEWRPYTEAIVQIVTRMEEWTELFSAAVSFVLIFGWYSLRVSENILHFPHADHHIAGISH
jgi:hypothetical protein